MTKKKRIFIILAVVLAVLLAVAVTITVVFVNRNSSHDDPGPQISGGGGEQGGGSQGGGSQGGGSQGGGSQGGGSQGGGSQGGGSQGGGSGEHVHTMTEHKRQDATCTAEGTIAYWHCSGCNKDFLDKDGNQEAGKLTIDKLDHTPEEYTELLPTCDTPGKKYTRCSVCHTPLSGEEEIPALEHDWGEWEYNDDAKCGVDGTETKRCKRADCEASETRTKQGTALEHDYDENGVCRRDGCGDQNGPKKPSPDKPTWNGDKILFGSYPQTEVKESELKNTLTSQAGTLPTEQNAGEWTDYGYYIESSVQSYMWYQDISYGGEKYRGVYFTSYRPYLTYYSSSTRESYQDENGYYPNTVYWFKYEPIEWRVLEQKDGTALLMANIILDSQAYQNDSGEWIDYNTSYTHSNGAPAGTDVNNYEYSTIRSWLRDTFYETAFNAAAQSLIETTEVDNSAASTESNDNPYACENTQDKVFLLSYQEILNTSYGFNSSASAYDAARQLQSTDYAKSQGVNVRDYYNSVYDGNGWWLLRSPDYSEANRLTRHVSVYGTADGRYGIGIYYACSGVVPALRIRLS